MRGSLFSSSNRGREQNIPPEVWSVVEDQLQHKQTSGGRRSTKTPGSAFFVRKRSVLSLISAYAVLQEAFKSGGSPCKVQLRGVIGSATLITKKCVMCRRSVTIDTASGKREKRAEKANKKGTGPDEDSVQHENADSGSSVSQTSVLPGVRLTLCGCVFCRECLKNSASVAISDQPGDADGAAGCLCCGKSLLAGDLWGAISSKSQLVEVDVSEEFLDAEWNRVGGLVIEQSCQRAALATGRGGKLVCRDCNIVMIVDSEDTTNSNIVRCRNAQHCPNMFCTKCRHIVNTTGKFKRCVSGRCRGDGGGVGGKGVSKGKGGQK